MTDHEEAPVPENTPTATPRRGVPIHLNAAASAHPGAAPTADGQWHGSATVPDPVLSVRDLNVHYGASLAVRNVTLDMARFEITALIGPSGCGKSTVLRCLNRMNDLIPSARVTGSVTYHEQDIYAPEVDAIEVRRRIGMVFQKPNPFPKSIYDNIAFGPKVNGTKKGLDDIVEESLVRAALWDEVKDKLKTNAYGLFHQDHLRLGGDRDSEDRGPDGGAQARLHDRHRHAQHAAGGQGVRPDRLLHGRSRPAKRSAHWAARRGERHQKAVQQPR
jgi:ABC-type multidrug transport system fused ATPase/permease subunit